MQDNFEPGADEPMRRIVETVPSMLAYWDRELRCRFANRAYEEWFGVDPDSLPGTSIRDLLGPELFALNEPYMRAALRGEAQVFERFAAPPVGSGRHALIHYLPAREGDTVVGFIVQVTDVSALKQVQERLQSTVDSLAAEVQRRRATEQTLAESEQNLAVTLASIGAGFIAADRSGRVTKMNEVAEAVTGWTQAEALGRSVWTVFDREDRPASTRARSPVDVMIEQAVTVQTAHHVVAIARHGTRTPLEVRAALTYHDDGSVRGTAMVFRDMSRLERAELESNRLAALVESSGDAIIGKTLDGRITSWNAAAQALFGWTAAEAIGQPIQMMLPPEREAEEMRMLAALARGTHVPPFDTQRRAKDGSLREVSVAISPIRDAQGRVIGASKIARDVSQQRRAEAALRDSEARLRFAVESAQIGEWELDLASGVIQRSLRHDRCFGYDQMLPAWTVEDFIRHVHPDDRALITREFRDAAAAARDCRAECRVVWPDQSIHWISADGTIFYDRGKPSRMRGIITDITAHKRAEEARLVAIRLEAENRQIQEASRLKSRFLATMSHELRTPLNAVIGFADLLLSGAVNPDSPKQREFVGHIATSGRHLLALINDVLDLSKIEAGKFEFMPEPLDLRSVIDEVRGVLQAELLRKQLHLDVDVDASLDRLELDAGRLKQVLYNYVSNAIKFTASGGRVVIRARPEGAAQFRIEVEDNGIGIAEADLARLFNEFEQLDASSTRKHQGTGLGLALTRRLVQAQGGRVGVRSVFGQGSVFWFVLDRVHRRGADGAAADVAAAPVDARTSAAAPAEKDGLAPQRLLVIEDDSKTRNLMSKALADAGFGVDTASTGRQALEHAQDRAYDAITLDLQLPDRAGLGLLADIRSHGPNARAPVVCVSLPSPSGAVAAFAVANVLHKPIRTDEVARAVARLKPAGARRTKVMVIDDDPLALEMMRATLVGIGTDVVGLLDGRRALRELDLHRPDAIILDLLMPEFDGFAVLDALRRLPAGSDLPVYIWTSMILTDADYAGLKRTALDIMNKGGGALDSMLVSLRQWRPAALPNH